MWASIGFGKIHAVAVLWSSNPGLTQGRSSQLSRHHSRVRLQIGNDIPVELRLPGYVQWKTTSSYWKSDWILRGTKLWQSSLVVKISYHGCAAWCMPMNEWMNHPQTCPKVLFGDQAQPGITPEEKYAWIKQGAFGCRLIRWLLKCCLLLQTIGGDNDYVKVPAVRPRSRPVTSPPAALSPPSAPQPVPPPTDVTPTPEAPATQPSQAEPIVYERIRSDATVGDVPAENPYLVPADKLQRSARPVDLSDLLADQQLNAVAASSSVPSHSAWETSPREQYDDAMSARDLLSLNSTHPSTSPPESSALQLVYTNLVDIDLRPEPLPTSGASLLIDLTTDSAPGFSTASAETSVAVTASSDNLRRPSVPVSPLSSSGPAACRPPGTEQFLYAFRPPSYEESMSSDLSSMSMSPIASPSLSSAETMLEASVFPGFESPPAYVSDRLLELNANTPLKSRQVHQLQHEMACAAGIRVQLDKTQCKHALALVSCFNRVW